MVPVRYVGPVDEIDTRRLDGTEITVARGEVFEVTEEEAPLFAMQPDNFEVASPFRPKPAVVAPEPAPVDIVDVDEEDNA